MREIDSKIITKEVKKLCIEGNIFLGDDVIKSFEKNLEKEESELGKDILRILIENAQKEFLFFENDVRNYMDRKCSNS